MTLLTTVLEDTLGNATTGTVWMRKTDLPEIRDLCRMVYMIKILAYIDILFEEMKLDDV